MASIYTDPVEVLLDETGANSVELQRELAWRLGQPRSESPERGGAYWVKAGNLLTIRYFQGKLRAIDAYRAGNARSVAAAAQAGANVPVSAAPQVNAATPRSPARRRVVAAGVGAALSALTVALVRRLRR
jgi:hypothetical protein